MTPDTDTGTVAVRRRQGRPDAGPTPRGGDVPAIRAWLADSSEQMSMAVDRVRLDDIDPWLTDPGTGDVVHPSGHFFRVTGLQVDDPEHPERSRSQPIIDQPEIGILGLLAARVRGRLQVLVQAKAEPGNCNGIQISPTVQATWSNYTRVHGGSAVPYLSWFRTAESRGRVLIDVLQSEQAAWFFQKRNRNMLVLVDDPAEVEVVPGFRWVTLEDLYRCLLEADLVNMDTRTVLSCLPLHAIGGWVEPEPGMDDQLAAAVRRSLHPESPSAVSYPELLSWVTSYRSQPSPRARLVPLRTVDPAWERTPWAVRNVEGGQFDIVGVRVTARGREVREWRQPLLAPHGEELAACLATVFDGVLHLLVRIVPSPGYRERVELGPAVQCVVAPAPEPPPPFHDLVSPPTAGRVVFESVLSEEGGRFLNARTRYRIVEIPPETPLDVPDGFRWVTLRQLGRLLQHSHYVNVEARTLVAAAHGLAVGRETGRP
jgi:oxidase EvaA